MLTVLNFLKIFSCNCVALPVVLNKFTGSTIPDKLEIFKFKLDDIN